MTKHILLEEFHLTVFAPRGLAATEYEAMRQTLTAAQFVTRLRRAVRRVFHREGSLRNTKVRLSR